MEHPFKEPFLLLISQFVKNEKANEAVMAFNFFKTVDEIKESVALDTDLKHGQMHRDGTV